MSKLQGMYDRAPLWLQNVMVSARGYLNQPSRYGREYRDFRRFLETFDTWSLDRQQAYQQETLVRFVRYAAAHSPFYRQLYRDVDVQSIRTIDDLKKLPVVDKELLRAHMDTVRVPAVGPTVTANTGGTTGKSLTVVFTRADFQRRMAQLDHFKARVGFAHRRMRRATFNGKHIVPPGQTKPVYWRYNRACRQMIYSSFHLTEETMGRYVDSLNEFKPQALDGFFTCMVDLAGYIRRHHRMLTFTPVAIFPTSETLTQEGRALLEEVFGCRVYDQYASSEGAPFVTECPAQTLHQELASGVFEPYGDTGEVLVTSFTTHATPLIRYRIGDRMDLSGATCACGLAGPTVGGIEGRRLDFLYTAQGAKINAGVVANLLKYLPNSVIRSQFIQQQKGAVTLLLEVDSRRFTPEQEGLLRQEFRHTFGEDTTLTLRCVDHIEREASGKYRFIKNEAPV